MKDFRDLITLNMDNKRFREKSEVRMATVLQILSDNFLAKMLIEIAEMLIVCQQC